MGRRSYKKIHTGVTDELDRETLNYIAKYGYMTKWRSRWNLYHTNTTSAETTFGNGDSMLKIEGTCNCFPGISLVSIEYIYSEGLELFRRQGPPLSRPIAW